MGRISRAATSIALMDALGIDKAHVVGHSMGAYTALHVGIRHPQRCISVTAAGCGWGSLPDPAARESMRKLAAKTAKMFTEKGMAEAAVDLRRRRQPATRRNTRTRAAMPNSSACCRSIRRRATR